MTRSHPTCCPQGLFGIANQFAMVIGEGPAEALTWRTAPFIKDGTRYGTYNLTLRDSTLHRATQPLVRPEWDTGEIIDMDAASECQARIDFVNVAALQEGDPFPQPAPDRILVLINHGDIASAVQAWGLDLVRPININTADAATLQTLIGVGASLASQIIDGRPWADPADLASIGGISAGMVEGWMANPGLEVE